MSKRFDDDYYDGFQKFHHKAKKNKYKGHQSKHGMCEAERWQEPEEVEEVRSNAPLYPSSTPPTNIDYRYRPENEPIYNKPITTATTNTTHVFGPNTRTIKGIQIDMDGVVSIEKIENVKDGVRTFGIKFTFAGKKGFYRNVWFNQNVMSRDQTYMSEYDFWKTIPKKGV